MFINEHLLEIHVWIAAKMPSLTFFDSAAELTALLPLPPLHPIDSPMKPHLITLAIAASLLSGCAFKTLPYGASASNVEGIRSVNIKAVAVSKFQSVKPGLASIICRAVGPVTVEPNFESYIEKAFVSELKLAGAYDPNSQLVLNGKLEEIDFNSGMSDGNWILALTISNARSESFTTKTKFNFAGSFFGDKACGDVSQAFVPAVQRLIEDVVRDPRFKQIAS